MESLNYGNLGNKINKRTDKNITKNEELKLIEILEKFKEAPHFYIDEKKIYNSYAREIENILGLASIEELIASLYALEKMMKNLKSIAPADYDIPAFEEFWKKLSPTLLLSLWDSLENEEQTEEIVKGWFEALRISLESELYLISERCVLSHN